MGLLSDVESEARVTVEKIDGGKEVVRQLEDLGIREGTELNVLAQSPVHEHSGAISLKAADREVLLGQGMAEKIYMDKEGVVLPLLEMEQGEKGVVESLRGGKEFKSWVVGLGIEEGVGLEILGHAPDYTLVFEIEGKTLKMGEGLASRILVEYEGETSQVNFLKEGEKTKIVKITHELFARQKLEDMGVREEAEITLTAKESVSPHPARGRYTKAQVGNEVITIGHGVAQKVWVE